MEKLDQVPWKQLKHAYGLAEDVPELLRALRTAPSDAPNDERSPLWHLFGNIWHQGTVYEATSYAVPFLLDLAADAQTPDRIGILGLLGEVATGTGDYAAKAHEAVAAGFDILLKVVKDTSDVGLAAAHVLAQLPERGAETGPLLRSLLDAETRHLQRAGLILLLGDLGDKSDAAISALSRALSGSDTMERQAAAVTVARLKPASLPPGSREAILETLTVEKCVSFSGLPWDVADEIDYYALKLVACLDGGDCNVVADRLISALEADTASQRQVWLLVELLFPALRRGYLPGSLRKTYRPSRGEPWLPCFRSWRPANEYSTAIFRVGDCRIPCASGAIWQQADSRKLWI